MFHQQLDRINELHNTGSESVTPHSTFLNGIIRVQVGIDYSAGKSSQFWNGVHIVIIEHPFKQFSDLTIFRDISNRPGLRAYELRDVFGPFNRSLHAHQISEGTAQFQLAGRYEFRLFEGRYSASACYTCM